MKGFLSLLVVCLLALSCYNAWQIHEMRCEVNRLQVALNEQKHATAASAEAARAATDALAGVRDALARVDMKDAQGALVTARQKVDEAVRVAETHARPAVNWLKGNAAEIGGHVRDRLNGLR